MLISEQLESLEKSPWSFTASLQESSGSSILPALSVTTFQVNVGKLCNQTCRHCHVDAGPKRTEIMSRQTMVEILHAIDSTPEVTTVDLTGGAPEMNPDFRWFVGEIKQRKLHVIDRCNLTILQEPGYEDMAIFLAENKVEIVASLPHFAAARTNQQRGAGVFEKSVLSLKKLNELGYAKNPDLKLNLVYNPTGLFLSPVQTQLEREYKEKLANDFGIIFNSLYCINNMPINRFLQSLLRADRFTDYMEVLVNAYNPATVEGLMCRHQVSIGWDGAIYDCDFNQMLEMPSTPFQHIRDWQTTTFKNRNIALANHCFGCTAGNGSSCGGEIS